MSEQRLKTLRVLWVGLLASPVLLLMCGYYFTRQQPNETPSEPTLLFVLGAAAVGSAVASVVLPRVMLTPALLALELPVTDAIAVGPSRGRRRARRFQDPRSARERLLSAALGPFVVGMALAEAVAFMGFLLWLLGFPFMYVGWMFVVCIVLMLSKFPRPEPYAAALEAAYDADLTG